MSIAEQIDTLRRQWADIKRNNPDPPHGADGRFYSSGSAGGGEHISMPAHAPGGHISEHGETPRPIADQCSNCGKIRSSWHPLAGQRVPDDPSEPRSHGGFCPECHKTFLEENYLPYLLEKQHMSRDEGMAVIEQLVASARHQYALDDAAKAKQYEQWLSEQSPSSEQRAQHLHALATQVMQVAEQVRRAGYPLRDGRGRWIGWVGADGVAHMNGEGHAHTGWEGVTHHSAHTGERGGGKSGGTKTQSEATSKASATDNPDRAAYLRELQALGAKYADLHASDPAIAKAHAAAEKAARGGRGGKASGKTHTVIEDDGLVPKRRVENEILLGAPTDARYLRELYGHDQLAKALARYTAPLLKEAADKLGVPVSRSKADTIARILDKLKNESETTYSDMQRPGYAPPKTEEPATPRGGAKTAGAGKAIGSRKKAADAVTKDNGLVAITDHADRTWEFDPASPPDPIFLRNLYGDQQLRTALDPYPVTELRKSFVWLRNSGYAIESLPRNANREDLIKALMDFAQNPKKASRAALPSHIDLAGLSHRVNGVIADLRRIA